MTASLELAPAEAQHRFNRVFRRFLGVFATSERPLVLFLDDLQWADLASLQLLQHLLTHPETPPVLLIGAYRDNEVSPSHPLMLALEELRRAGARMSELKLEPLSLQDTRRLVADTLPGAGSQVIDPLAALARRYADWLTANAQADIADVCVTAGTGRAHFEHRAALVVDSVEGAAELLSGLAEDRLGPGAVRGVCGDPPKTAWLFTGQGSHYPGMARELFGEASDHTATAYNELASLNQDLGEYWEFSDTGLMPVDLSNEAYKFGVNYFIYGLTH